MQTNLLIIYSSVDGQTLKICNALTKQLEEHQQPVDLFSIDTFQGDLSAYSKIVIGSSIRYGVHNKKIIEFIKSHKEELESKTSVFFSVNLVARKPEKSAPETNTYVVKFFKTIDWKPTLVEVFAGKIDYKKYSFFDRIMIQLIMWMTHGPTNRDAEIEYTKWDRVHAFGEKLRTL
ncbi:MAG: menaquinone-dependent protoporphyrinogen IX dehydrogenase [Flavobacteriales bacterium]|nr:menaquinone-dependent protoporphyrinogen IX dehydrogenase [Flavobacteriia bacterium]NCP04803.1 menaquinone-dependent protoporphyrinogen IX dehydrogenase [Flavobacteriales bacterium]PIV92688.1 MAG: menaquinone-dependent protoporphyrinogen IX dehydrogenase [Flavobacteriaceae bacterium CG17_big_fil_post_rev_8_21_14_2_50_33_15]PIY11150.1 MAG: menaquinone-dependent protoporphyrinogen IX dehydrogenase [Flavobacteriaceae bacterium CG_4_10_14_3_um_filter_33_47]PJB17835.1 MAG: menaquinone-dependent p